MTFIPPRDRPIETERYRDPVTGASILRPRRTPAPRMNSNSQGGPLPATCTTPYCAYAGKPHDRCEERYHSSHGYGYPPEGYDPTAWYHTLRNPPAQYDPTAWYTTPRRRGNGYDPTAWYTRQTPGHTAGNAEDENTFRRWITSHPHWQIPREMPNGWRPPYDAGDLLSSVPRTPYRRLGNNMLEYDTGDPTQSMYVFTDRRPRPNYGYDAAYAAHRSPYRRAYRSPRASPPPERAESPFIPPATAPVMPTPGGGWPTADDLPIRPPDRMEWSNVQGGNLTWTPNPWVAHPLPHPSMPAQQFWNSITDPWQAWRGPGGWSPALNEMSAQQLHLLTGGHPLPGMDPNWTPTGWVRPLCAPSSGVIVSPFLAPNPRNASVPHILWDAAIEPPERIKRMTSRGGIVEFATTDHFKAIATCPETTDLQIHIQHMRSSWGPVNVSKSAPITIGDVFRAVWEYLHKPITSEDQTAVLYSQGGYDRWRRIHYACYRRCTSAPGLLEYERLRGIKRIDFLEGETIFWGVWPCFNPDGTWYLSMGFVPRSFTVW